VKPPAEGQVDVFDGGYPGLALRVSYGGRKSFVYFYRFAGKQRRLGLGTYPAVKLAEARDAWRAARDALHLGQDPETTLERPTQAAEVVEAPAADLFETILAEWLAEAHADTKPKTKPSIECMFAWNVQGGGKGSPNWNGRSLASITREEAKTAIYAIADPRQAHDVAAVAHVSRPVFPLGHRRRQD
jgi:Arm DNA-binding domain